MNHEMWDLNAGHEWDMNAGFEWDMNDGYEWDMNAGHDCDMNADNWWFSIRIISIYFVLQPRYQTTLSLITKTFHFKNSCERVDIQSFSKTMPHFIIDAME